MKKSWKAISRLDSNSRQEDTTRLWTTTCWMLEFCISVALFSGMCICCTVLQVPRRPQRHPGSSFLSLCASTILCIELVKVLRQSTRWFTWPPCCRSRRWCQGGQTSTWRSSLPTVQYNCSSLFLCRQSWELKQKTNYGVHYHQTLHHVCKDGVKVNQCVASSPWMYCSLGQV